MERNTFEIPVERVADLEHEIAKLNKRADKLGVQPISLTKGVITEHKVRDELSGVDTFESRQHIEIVGDSPKLNGWEFVATLEHDENGTLIRKLPHATDFDLTAYRTATPDHCDHCGYKRRRNDTYIVGNVEQNETKQVGSNCLKDFIGHKSPHLIARYLEAVADLIENVGSGGYSESSAPQRYSTETFLAHTAAMIHAHGWVSRSAARDSYGVKQATADDASNNLYLTQRRKPEAVEPSEADYELAQATLAWVRELDEDALSNDYMYNLYTSLKGESIPARQFGIAASAINAYERAQEREIQRRQRFADRTDEHLGSVGQKISITGVLTRISWIESIYSESGTIPLYIFRASTGHDVKWFSSRDLELEQGASYKVTGCVKKHETHREYGKSTVITRAKVEKI